MEKNVADYERVISLAAGGALAAAGLRRRRAAGIGMAALGGLLIFRGLSGYCGLYRALGLSSRARAHGLPERETAAPQERSVHGGVLIELPRQAVYSAWRRLEDQPRFITGLQSVDVLDDALSHWTAFIAGREYEWDSEIVEDRPGEEIRWRTVGAADLPHSGSVIFQDARGGGTEVHLTVHYQQPLRGTALSIADLLGLAPGQGAAQSIVLRFRDYLMDIKAADAFEQISPLS